MVLMPAIFHARKHLVENLCSDNIFQMIMMIPFYYECMKYRIAAMRQMTSSLQSVMRSLNATMRTKAKSKQNRDSKNSADGSDTTAAAPQADHEQSIATTHRPRKRTELLTYEFQSEQGTDYL